MNLKPTCPPEKPESGQKYLTAEQKTALLNAACTAEQMARQLWRAYYACKYNDKITCENGIDEARTDLHIIRNKLKQLPPLI